MKRSFHAALVLVGCLGVTWAGPARADDPFTPSSAPPRRLHFWQNPHLSPQATPKPKPKFQAQNFFKSIQFTPYQPVDDHERFGWGPNQVPLGGYLSGSSGRYDPHYGCSPGFYYGFNYGHGARW